jgi:hypothetical protein
LNYQETKRHNKYTEGYGDRSLNETIRHNVAQENIGYANVALGYAGVGAQYANIAEMQRHNEATEAQYWAMFPYESSYKSAQTGYTNTNKDWVTAKIDETQAHTNLMNIQSIKTVGDMIIDVIKVGTGLAILP